MKYDSLQGFLQGHLKDGGDHSPETIEALKVRWRKEYLAMYHKKYQEDHVQITFRLGRKQYRKLITIAKQQDQKPMALCRRLVIDSIDSHARSDLQPFRIQLMELIDTIEQSQYEGKALPSDKLLKTLTEMLDKLK